MAAGKALQPVERARRVEHGGIAFQREGRVEDAGAAAGGLLGIDRVRRRVGAEEEFGIARRRRGDQRLPVALALEDRQAIEVRPDAPGEQRVAAEVEVVRA